MYDIHKFHIWFNSSSICTVLHMSVNFKASSLVNGDFSRQAIESNDFEKGEICFKKSRVMTLEEIESNDDVLMEILVRLPPKFVFKFRCVSKRWNKILSDPYFYQSYRVRARNVQLFGVGGKRLLAFIQARSPDHVTQPILNILPVIQKTEYKFRPFPSYFGNFVHSSDGLILCDKYPKYFVVNPLTRTWIQLPHPNTGSLQHMGLVCEENTHELAPCFKVVGIAMAYEREEDNTMLIETYSSKTGKWITSTLVGTEELQVSIGIQQFVYNGVFYWHTGDRNIIVYDSNRAENCVQLIKEPPSKPYHLILTKPSADDFLWAGTHYSEWSSNSHHRTIKFWKIPVNGRCNYKHGFTATEDEWILVHTIDKESLCQEMRLLLGNKKRKKSLQYAVNVTIANELNLVELIPSNPVTVVLLLSPGHKMFLYNLESKSVELVPYCGSHYSGRYVSGWHIFMGSLYLSTFGCFAKPCG